MAGVTLDTVRKVYAGNVEAVKGVSLGIEDGSFCVLVGPFGLRQVHAAAHDRRARDDLRRRGEDRRPRRERGRARRPRHRDGVPELRALSAHERLRQHGLWPEEPRHAQGRDREARARKRRASSPSSPSCSASRAQLSGGQRQRVAMGRAIVRKPQVFLFDEPLSNLDAKLRVQMRVEIKRLQRALGVTSIYVTHDQVEAMTLSDKLVVMSGGQIEQVGTPSDVYRRPETRFVATFIGSPPMNILPGKVEGPGRVSVGGPDDHGDRHARRPCRRLRHRGRPPAGRRAGAARAGAARSTLRRRFRRGTRRDPALPRQGRGRRIRRAGLDRPACGGYAPLTLSIDADNVHLFDAQTTKRLGRN